MLIIKRRKAESKLIKLRILKKLHDGIDLSKIEEDYKAQWKKSIKSTNLLSNSLISQENVLDLDSIFLPESFTTRAINSLSNLDKKELSQLQYFNIDAVKHLALSDLILELSGFYDESLINRV
jgi:hypothetical protein